MKKTKYSEEYLALGLLGGKKEMMGSLKISSKLCKKPMSYTEFAETLKSVSEISYLN